MLKCYAQKSIFVLLVCSLFSLKLFAKNYKGTTTGYSGTGANIDVKFQRCNWRINPDSSIKAIGGSVTTYFKTITSNVSDITFDLSSVFTSVTASYHGVSITITRPSTNVIKLTLPVTLGFGVLDSVTVFYNGTPPAPSGSAEGYQSNATASYKTSNPTAQGNFIYSLSESYEDRAWWPCKADMQDKVDSMDIIVSVPWKKTSTTDTFWVATNGVMTDSAIVGTSRIFKFKTRYPIASYLVCIGVAKYDKYYSTVNIGGTNVPVVYNVYAGKTTAKKTTILTALNKSKDFIQAFSNKFGDYPFKNEKHGYYEVGWPGGMEHQTFSAMGESSLSSASVVAHELAHQWFGDKVTFSTWNNLWLAEGFADYCEALAGELVPTSGINPITKRATAKSAALSYLNTSIYVPTANIATTNTIWSSNYGGSVYDRGGMMISMLRALVGDAIFFQAVKNYINDPALAYGSATTENLQNHFQSLLGGFDLTSFFADFVYGTGNPVYDINWASTSNSIVVQLATQTKTTGSTVTYFHTPIPLRLQGANGEDTVIVIYDNNGTIYRAGNGINNPTTGNTITVPLNFKATAVTFDAYSQTLATATVTNLATLDVTIKDFAGVSSKEGNQLLLSLYDDTKSISKIVLQRSANAVDFKDNGTMNIKNNTADNFNYSYTDALPLLGENYYRAAIYLKDGQVVYTKVVMLASEKITTTVSIFPNPASDQLNIKIVAGNQLNNIYIKLIDAMGRTVAITNKLSNNAASINVSSLSQGKYILQVYNNTELQSITPVIITH